MSTKSQSKDAEQTELKLDGCGASRMNVQTSTGRKRYLQTAPPVQGAIVSLSDLGEFLASLESGESAKLPVLLVRLPYQGQPLRLPAGTYAKAEHDDAVAFVPEREVVPPASPRADGGIRINTGLSGFDHVLGGGLSQGSTILLCGPAGVGKTSLLMALAHSLAQRGDVNVPFIHTEQQAPILEQQFAHLWPLPPRMALHCLNDRNEIVETLRKRRSAVCIVDSIEAIENAVGSRGRSMAAGGPRALAQIGADLRAVAIECGSCIIATAHTTSDGTPVGGPRVRRAFDVVLTLKFGDDKKSPHRILEADGPRDLRAVFEMGEHGLRDLGPTKDSV